MKMTLFIESYPKNNFRMGYWVKKKLVIGFISLYRYPTIFFSHAYYITFAEFSLNYATTTNVVHAHTHT